MTLAAQVISEIATSVGLVPLAWLSCRYVLGYKDGERAWYFAMGFAISWLADVASHVGGWETIRLVYPISQAAIIGVPFLKSRDRMLFLFTLTAVGIYSSAIDHDIPLRVVAWLGLCAIVRASDRYSATVYTYFGAGLLAWTAYDISPGWPTYLIYQGCRAAGVLIFCWSSRSPEVAL